MLYPKSSCIEPWYNGEAVYMLFWGWFLINIFCYCFNFAVSPKTFWFWHSLFVSSMWMPPSPNTNSLSLGDYTFVVYIPVVACVDEWCVIMIWSVIYLLRRFICSTLATHFKVNCIPPLFHTHSAPLWLSQWETTTVSYTGCFGKGCYKISAGMNNGCSANVGSCKAMRTDNARFSKVLWSCQQPCSVKVESVEPMSC